MAGEYDAHEGHRALDQRRLFVTDVSQARVLDERSCAPGGVMRRHQYSESFPFCARHATQRIDFEPCLRCRIDLLETKLAGAEQLVRAQQVLLEDIAPKVLSLGDTLTELFGSTIVRNKR